MDVPFQDRGHDMTTERRIMTFFYARILGQRSCPAETSRNRWESLTSLRVTI